MTVNHAAKESERVRWVELSAILCNHAETQNNFLYISGGGIDRALIPPGVTPPWGLTVGIGMVVQIPWTQTNQEHTLTVDLVDADGQPVHVPVGPDQTAPLHAELRFNAGRPPTLAVGEAQNLALALNIPNLAMDRLGRYVFVISIDQTEVHRLDYQVVSPPAMNVNMGGVGPSALPPMM
jgi:hypothetical protein